LTPKAILIIYSYMKLKFIVDCELNIVTQLNEEQEPIETVEVFRIGEIIECDLIDHPERMVEGEFIPDTNLWNVQFGDGSMAFGVSREWFEII
jgi:hypothetical protein